MFTYKESVSGITMLYIAEAVLQFNVRYFYLWILILHYFTYLSYWFLKAADNLSNSMNKNNTKKCKMNSNQDPLQKTNTYKPSTKSVQYQISSKLLCLVCIFSWSKSVLQDHSLKEAISSCLVGPMYHYLLPRSNQHLLNNGHELKGFNCFQQSWDIFSGF